MQQCSPDPCLPILLQCLWPLGLARMYMLGFLGVCTSLIASVCCLHASPRRRDQLTRLESTWSHPKAQKRGKRKLPTPDLDAIEDVEERRRQRRLVKNRNTAAASRCAQLPEHLCFLNVRTVLPVGICAKLAGSETVTRLVRNRNTRAASRWAWVWCSVPDTAWHLESNTAPACFLHGGLLTRCPLALHARPLSGCNNVRAYREIHVRSACVAKLDLKLSQTTRPGAKTALCTNSSASV